MTDSAVAAVRPAGPADIDAMGRLFEDAFDEPYGAAAVADLLKPPAAWALVAEMHAPGGAARPVGFLIAATAADETEIFSIGIASGYRRRGIGILMINHMLHLARSKGAEKVFLEVAADNTAGIALYAAAGFERVGVRRNYYKRRGGERADALILRRDLY